MIGGDGINIGICDDLPVERERLRDLILAKLPDASVLEYTSGEELLAGLNRSNTLDLLFLDICMGGLNGIEVAKEIRQQDMELPILFLTTSPEFAVASYRVQAQDYLLKPVVEDDLFQSLDRQIRRLAQRETKIFFQTTAHGILQIPLSQIVYIEVVARRLILVHQDGSTSENTDSIQNMEQSLAKSPQFVRPHRSYLVNLQHVKRMDKDSFHMATGAFVPIARSNMAAMKSQYMNQMLDW